MTKPNDTPDFFLPLKVYLVMLGVWLVALTAAIIVYPPAASVILILGIPTAVMVSTLFEPLPRK